MSLSSQLKSSEYGAKVRNGHAGLDCQPTGLGKDVEWERELGKEITKVNSERKWRK